MKTDGRAVLARSTAIAATTRDAMSACSYMETQDLDVRIVVGTEIAVRQALTARVKPAEYGQSLFSANTIDGVSSL